MWGLKWGLALGFPETRILDNYRIDQPGWRFNTRRCALQIKSNKLTNVSMYCDVNLFRFLFSEAVSVTFVHNFHVGKLPRPDARLIQRCRPRLNKHGSQPAARLIQARVNASGSGGPG
jgi:hypothetical protein